MEEEGTWEIECYRNRGNKGRMALKRCGEGRQSSLCDWIGMCVAKSWLLLKKIKLLKASLGALAVFNL